MGVGYGPTGRVHSHSKPPGSIKGIRKYYSERGYHEGTLLETKEENQVTSFVKPIPSQNGQSRHHVRIIKTRKQYVIDSHVDGCDPNNNPIGHFSDILFSPQHKIQRVRRVD